ncbi:MAG: C10 family peptidase [Muribaculaceae bacterium]|nr:C10 family peptidase [Muribaculaceae bacterium]
MLKKISQPIAFLLAMFLLSTPAWSAPRDKQAMLQTARQALTTMTAGGHRFNASSPLTEARVTSAYSLYQTRQGDFAMIAADDRLPAVLAVGNGRASSAGQANPGFEWFCQSIEEVSRIVTGRDIGFTTTLPDPAKYPAKVDALITSQWGQDAPYSYWCPTGYGEICDDYTPDVVHCCVGCVATALAQIVRYYRFPDHAAGTANFLIGDKEASTSFDATFDWDNMLDSYPEGQYTEAQGRAVALLSYVCGLVSWMTYATNESGSSNQAGVAGAQNYFGYSKDAATVVRSDYSEPEWMDMVYNELSHRRPLYYQGVYLKFDPSVGLMAAGHSFVIDGYNEEGLVHVNWGWYGNYDGYFDIALLEVRGLQFNSYQDMVINFVPDPDLVGLTGDVNDDKVLNIIDATLVINYLLNNDASQLNLTKADFNGDGSINITDAVMLIDNLLHQ